MATHMYSFFTEIPLKVMPQVNTEIGIKVNEFGDKFKISALFGEK
jgi:hypothetical protein